MQLFELLNSVNNGHSSVISLCLHRDHFNMFASVMCFFIVVVFVVCLFGFNISRQCRNYCLAISQICLKSYLIIKGLPSVLYLKKYLYLTCVTFNLYYPIRPNVKANLVCLVKRTIKQLSSSEDFKLNQTGAAKLQYFTVNMN